MEGLLQIDLSLANYLAPGLLGVLTFYLIIYQHSRKNSLLPPGPRGLPLVGNLFQFPKSLAGPYWAKQKDIYGMHSSY